MPRRFEYHLLKSLNNWWKHGITLAQAEDLWLDPAKVYIRARYEKEPRFAVLARHKGKIWHCTFTLRGGAIRLISCRWARRKEVSTYHRGGI